MLRLTNEQLLVRVVDAVEETVESKRIIYNFPFSQILLCEAGEGYIISEGGAEQPLCRGDMVFVDEALKCALRTSGEAFRLKKIACDTTMAPNLMNYFSYGRLHIMKGCSAETRRLYMELFEKGKDAAVSENRAASLKMYRLIIMLGQEIADSTNSEAGAMERMARVYSDFMFSNYKAGENLELAPEIDSLFKRLYNMNAEEYNVYMRLERGKPDVVFSHDYDELAKYLGFKSEADFVRRFKLQYGIYPHEFKALYN